MLKARELTVRSAIGTIAVKIWGESTEAARKFLAVHGWLDNAGSFDSLRPHFLKNTQDRCVVCIDLPGHGLSSHHSTGVPHTPASEVIAMRNIIKQLGWDRYNLIGHSMGGMRCQNYTFAWPREVQSVVLIDGFIIPTEFAQFKYDPENTPFIDFGTQADTYLKFMSENNSKDKVSDKNKGYTREELIQRWLKSLPQLTEADVNVLMKRGSTKLDNGGYIYTRDPAQLIRHNSVIQPTIDTVLKSARNCKAKHLVIRATQGLLLNSGQSYIDYLKRACNHFPNMTEATVNGTHYIHMQTPENVASVMNEFLEGVTESSSKSRSS